MNVLNWKSKLCSRSVQLARLPGKIRNIFGGVRSDTAINEVLLYGAEDEEERRRVGLNNLFCIYYVLIHSSISIDICAPSLTSATITKALIDVKRKGEVKIRIAIYKSVDYSSLQTLSKYGIEVKAISSAVQLEHEFILIDALDCVDAVAIVGSLDYELTRVNCNRGTTLITSQLQVVSALKLEFERIWDTIPDIMKSYYDDQNKSQNA